MENLLIIAVVFLLGTIIGSFVGLCAYRIPRRETILWGGSRCDYCDEPLPWRYKFPLLGYLLLKGRSACCHRPIPLRYPLTELTTGVLFLVLFYDLGPDVQLPVAAVFVGLLLVGALIDLQSGIIPNRLTAAGVAVGVGLSAVLHQGWPVDALLGVVICGGFLYLGGVLGEVLFGAHDGMGGGDIKFAAMIGAFLGWQMGLLAVVLAALTGVVFGGARMAVQPEGVAHREIRFGPFLAGGALVGLLWGHAVWDWYLSLIGGF
ncbi:MAG: prepilin peptidase [Calditrichaeota bacterium]|nr:MAG: prepilin peptidase [Calditrichota bacterium]